MIHLPVVLLSYLANQTSRITFSSQKMEFPEKNAQSKVNFQNFAHVCEHSLADAFSTR